MPKYFLLGTLITVICCDPLYCQPEIEWMRMFDLGGSERFYDIYSLENGGYAMCGNRKANNGQYFQALMFACTEEGREVWNWSLEGEQEDTYLQSIIEADNGDLVAAGQMANTILAIRLTSNGERVWVSHHGSGQATGIIELKSGDFMLCGKYFDNSFIMRINGEGEEVWYREYSPDGIRMCGLYGLREREEDVIAAGSIAFNDIPGSSMWAMRVEQRSGDIVWSESFEIDSVNNCASMVSTGDGDYMLAGTVSPRNVPAQSSSYDFGIVKIDGDGDLIWVHRYPFQRGDGGESLKNICRVTNDRFGMVGYRTGEDNNFYPVAIMIDHTGALRWERVLTFRAEDGFGEGRISYHHFLGCVGTHDNGLMAAGNAHFNLDNTGLNGLLVKVESDIPQLQLIRWSPVDTVFSCLSSDTILFEVEVDDPTGNIPDYLWITPEDTIVGDTSLLYSMPDLGRYDIACLAASDVGEIKLTWHVTVTDLYISAFTPDTLDLTFRRGSSADFSIDTVRFTDGAEPEYLWTVTNLDNPGEPEFGGSETAATITFNQSGSYTVEGLAHRGESSDAVTWNVTVRGAIWAFAPEELAFEVSPDSLLSFAVEPTVPDAEGQTIRWLVDGEVVAEDTTLLQWSFGSVDNFPRYLAQVQVVVADTVEADTVSWQVTVREPEAVGDKRDGHPTRMELLSVSPNPFNSMLTIRYATGSAARPTRLAVGARHAVPLQIAIYDISGRIVAEIASPTDVFARNEETKQSVGGFAKTSSVVWDASAIPAGVYFVRLQSGREIVTKKVVLMK